MKRLMVVLFTLAVFGCSMMGPSYLEPVKLTDGSLPLPADYKSWPKFLSEVQKKEAKQVREIYVNPTGAATQAGQPFPNGTIFVMENYKARENSDGTLETGADGKLVKGPLAKVFIMRRGDGYGQNVPDELKTGSWAFGSYNDNGTPATFENYNKCRSCHVPAANNDFVLRYNEYFEKRAKM
ncbi:MAG: cytochrome P460 family protein [Nitrospiraceae bacterium]